MIGILALVGALAMLQSGQIDIAALTAKAATTASDSSKGKKGKPPVLFPRAEVAVIPVVPAGEQPGLAAIDRRQPRRELYQALARMDGETAANMLAEMDDPLVIEMLLALRERDLARILEAAPPVDAGRWATSLLEAAQQLELSEALAADAAGAESISDMEPVASADAGAEDPASGAEGDSPVAEDETATPANPAEAPGDNGAATDAEVPGPPPDTNTA